MGDNGKVIIEFLFKLADIPNVVYPLVKSTAELWGNRLQGNFPVGNRCEDDQ